MQIQGIVFAGLLIIAVLALANANGANDNFKGVASLYGSGTTSYRLAVGWATLTTAAGSAVSILLASALLHHFSGKGLVPDALIGDPAFLFAVAAGSGLSGLLATWLGYPVSTTHILTGALVGAGWLAGDVHVAKLWAAFLKPLLLSPLIAIVAGSLVFLLLRSLRLAPDHRTRSLDLMHFLSAGAVSFARGLNDTPKMAALLLGLKVFQGSLGSWAIAVMIAVGGMISARRVADTLAHKITGMNPGQGFAANLASALMVTTASLHGLPVSTTHVTVGALLGIGITTRRARWRTAVPVLAAWVITLPASAFLAAVVFQLVSS